MIEEKLQLFDKGQARGPAPTMNWKMQYNPEGYLINLIMGAYIKEMDNVII